MIKTKSRKPLIYWCRWHDAVLRLRGKDEGAVWGEFYYPSAGDGDEERQPFRFDLLTWQLTYGAEGAETTVQLDEMGVVRPFDSDADMSGNVK